MNYQNLENEIEKLCSKCGIVKIITNFYFRNTNQKYRIEGILSCSIEQKEWRHKSYEKN